MSSTFKTHAHSQSPSSWRSLLIATTVASGLALATVGSSLAQEESTSNGKAFTPTWNVPYMTIEDRQVYLDVYTPTTDGPWPVVVAFHGMGPRDARTTYDVATDAAAQGMLVFTPTWLDGHSLPLTADGIDVLRQEANCAIAFAQQHAAGIGGDPDRTVAYGFSAGVTPAMWSALAPAEGPIAGCATDASPLPVSGVVVGEGDYLQYTQVFDGAFEETPLAMQAQGAALVDPAMWPNDLDARFFLWTAGDGSEPRSVSDAPDLLAQRDPTGSVRDDLARLGRLDDGVVTLVDAGALMADRLEAAGIEVTLEEYPGGHTTLDKVPQLIGYMQAAAGE